ncbi:hypothetical protein M0654_11235 [Rhizobium sp. NTR19]|uniref:Uncharacterized protein n=1 Tax=Neorhizobium turbinariae TaxID=2937795 RepID=A0ABT0IRR9_9HYPH|nr:hypothetical protein [Neorhizobium turbinariae]MCK8780559.1 hypothetical protein [Neorhizobium turbinariae]
MRVSTINDDPGFMPWAQARAEGRVIRVFLDGEEIDKCITADEETGLIVRPVLDVEGGCQVDPSTGSDLWTESVHGSVRVEVQ